MITRDDTFLLLFRERQFTNPVPPTLVLTPLIASVGVTHLAFQVPILKIFLQSFHAVATGGPRSPAGSCATCSAGIVNVVSTFTISAKYQVF